MEEEKSMAVAAVTKYKVCLKKGNTDSFSRI